jgi:high affinity Mn2+ porin
VNLSVVLACTTVLALRQGDSTVSTAAAGRRWWLSGQVNVIYQWHPAFRALYTGPNSLLPWREHATSHVVTLYTGLLVGRRTEFLFDLESAGGGGISQAFGLAGFTNLDVVRNPTLGAAPYIARAIVRHTVPLGGGWEDASPGPLALASRLPVPRLTIIAGKLGLPDFFDVNPVGGDSHLQFLNWTIDNNGAYDYAADTRGYTVGVVIEFEDHAWGARLGEALMPRVANGIDYDWHVATSHADNLELELRRGVLAGRSGEIRLLLYDNHARMGSYREAINAFLAGANPAPDITAHRRPGRAKRGVGLNLWQGIGDLRLFGRAGVNDGRVESFAYTEVDQSVQIGADLTGRSWTRDQDRIGLAFVSNGLGPDHREYLALGGRGFLLGDGRLNYGCEQIVEAYYTAHLWRDLSAALDLQRIAHPGYNRDRGPALVLSGRLHLDLQAP